jgi:hypothetical protein
VPFICATSDTSPTSQLKVTFLQTSAIEPQRCRPQPRKSDSGVQLTQCRYLRDVGGKRPGETILAKEPAGATISAKRWWHKQSERGRRTERRWMASRKQRPEIGPSAHSVRSSCGTTRAQAQRRHLRAHGRAHMPCSAYYAATWQRELDSLW